MKIVLFFSILLVGTLSTVLASSQTITGTSTPRPPNCKVVGKVAEPLAALPGAKAEFIVDEGKVKNVHAPSIAAFPDGALLAAWRGGTDEGGNKTGLYVAHSLPGGGWSTPRLIYAKRGARVSDPVIQRDGDGTLTIYIRVGTDPQNWKGCLVRSRDGGKTWDSSPTWLPDGILGPTRNKTITLENGTILAGSSVETPNRWYSLINSSSDGGKTWTRSAPILFGDGRDASGTIQPSLINLGKGRILGFFRSKELGRVCRGESFDGGRTWTKLQETDLKIPLNGGSALDSVRLDDGRILLVHNPSEKDRDRLTLELSRDDGRTFSRISDIDVLGPPVSEPPHVRKKGQTEEEFLEEEKALARHEISYPSIIINRMAQWIEIVYSYRRERIKHVSIPISSIP